MQCIETGDRWRLKEGALDACTAQDGEEEDGWEWEAEEISAFASQIHAKMRQQLEQEAAFVEMGFKRGIAVMTGELGIEDDTKVRTPITSVSSQPLDTARAVRFAAFLHSRSLAGRHMASASFFPSEANCFRRTPLVPEPRALLALRNLAFPTKEHLGTTEGHSRERLYWKFRPSWAFGHLSLLLRLQTNQC